MLSRTSRVLLRCLLPVAVAATPAMTAEARASSPVWLWPGAPPATPQTPAQAGVLPEIAAEALDKTMLNLPRQMEGRQNLLLLSWDRDQAGQIESWTAVAQALEHTQPGFVVYRMLVNTPENFIFRWWDNASLRAAETDPDLLHRDVPLYTDEARLRQAIGLSAGQRPVVALLVERSGRIVWKSTGPSTAASRASLLAAAHAQR
jgi:hypothetical protein